MDNLDMFENTEIIFIPVSNIVPSPYQPRRDFDREGISELAQSIKEYGIMQPISVRLINNSSYELVAGERRLRASKVLGLETIPAIIININDRVSAVLSLVENLQRRDLNYFEEAVGFKNLISDYSFTQEELAGKVGKSQSAIANKLRILRLPKSIQGKLLENSLSERHARAFLMLEREEDMEEIIEIVIKNKLTVKKTEELIKQTLDIDKDLNNPKNKRVIKRHTKDVRLFTNTIRQAVDIMNQSGVFTDYNIKEMKDGYEITIKINTDEN